MFYGKGDANLSGCSSISCVWLFKLQNFIEISGLSPNKCIVSEYEVPMFLGPQEWDILFGTPCIIGPLLFQNQGTMEMGLSQQQQSATAAATLIAIFQQISVKNV